MEPFWKAAAVILLAVILGSAIRKEEKDILVMLSVTACCIVMFTALHYLSDVLVFLWDLGRSTDCGNPFMGTLLNISAVALMTELTSLISTDAGNSSLGKAMQLLGNAAILFLSLPMFETFISIVQEILGFI